MSQRFLSEGELQVRIDKFLARKNREMIGKSEDWGSRLKFDFKNDSLIYMS